ncbi:hypothetical protein IV203_029612 [Nitzschia inconspicua]|uniref:Uncharacterized protein n=1 Tax=Nitzschia inconspicua TaxID=303405 RepID=A0A9K3Q0K0_9STRA|nr:hypothetical protein IV203_029612 [Nitzschia inconspicua]
MASDCETKFRVAIIGAGFAGLALANVLEQERIRPNTDASSLDDRRGKREISYRIFESKPRPIPIIGTIQLTFAIEFLKQVDLMDDAIVNGVFPMYSPQNNNSETFVNVSREIFLDLLRRNIDIQNNCHIVNVVSDPMSLQQARYKLVSEDGVEYGNFNLVVLADGLFGERSLLRHENIAARIGDCCWYSERLIWWDFGTTRIRQGADNAIRDAMELGKLLMGAMERDEDCQDWGSLLGMFAMPATNAFVKRKQQNVIALLVLSPILGSIFYQIFFKLT